MVRQILNCSALTAIAVHLVACGGTPTAANRGVIEIKGPDTLKDGEEGTYHVEYTPPGTQMTTRHHKFRIDEDDYLGDNILDKEVKMAILPGVATGKSDDFKLTCEYDGDDSNLKGDDGTSIDENPHHIHAAHLVTGGSSATTKNKTITCEAAGQSADRESHR